MTSPEYAAGVRHDSDDRHQHCADCDPRLFDALQCRARGVEAQAAYQEHVRDALDRAHEQFDAARPAYNAARDAAAPIVSELRQQLAQVIDQLRCLIDDDAEVRLIRCAFRVVAHRLDECGDLAGCHVIDDGDAEADAHGCDPDDIASMIAEIGKRVQAATAAFDDLITEPVDLPVRVAAVQAEVADIMAAMAGDPRTTDFKRLYAAALVARRHLAGVWRGFANTNAYIDCLCRILTCIFRGHTAIGLLTGRAAVQQCHREAAQARCDTLRQHTVDEVMAEYLRVRADPRRCADRDADPDDGEPPRRGDPETSQRDRQRDRDRDRYGPAGYDQNP